VAKVRADDEYILRKQQQFKYKVYIAVRQTVTSYVTVGSFEV